MASHEPIREYPRAVRPPYDEPVPGSNEVDRIAALLEPLASLEVTPVERSELAWLAGREVGTIAVVANLLWRCRETGAAGRFIADDLGDSDD